MKKVVPYSLIFLSLFVFLFLSFLLITNNLNYFDSVIYEKIIYQNDYLTILFNSITEFGDAIILIMLTLLFLLVIKNNKYGFLIAINLILSFLTGTIVKLFFLRNRPIKNVLTDTIGTSFPSSHSLVSTAFYGLLIYFVYQKIDNKLLKTIIILALSLLILLIMYSRVYLGAHYVSDVIAGFSLGISFLIIFIDKFVSKIINK